MLCYTESMQQPVSLASFTPDSIASNEFADVLPEYYKLREVIESQGWHDDQTVFDHSIESAKSLEEIVHFDYLAEQDRNTLIDYLNGKLETQTRLDLLRLATLLHDIGKLISLQHNAEGNTSSPSHGIIGEWVAQPIVDKFDLTNTEKKFVLGLISDHLVPSDLIEMSINNNTAPSDVLQLLYANRPGSTVELLLLGYADWLGCDVREPVRAERDKRVTVVHECLSLAAATLRGE